jgi:cytochrome c peroxidase
MNSPLQIRAITKILLLSLTSGFLFIADMSQLHQVVRSQAPRAADISLHWQGARSIAVRPAAKHGFFAQLLATASAEVATGYPAIFNDLASQGEDLFFNETFDGNGRTCGTCHPATENFTLTADFIATLAPDDPLFVAEFIPALMFGAPENLDAQGNPQRFENPALMRAFGLITENQDGMGDTGKRFNMRSIPHNIGMSASILTPAGALMPPEDRTGWSGDGAPIGTIDGIPALGRLEDFLLGAIVQHYPLTLARSFAGPNPDFRSPTQTELDAMAAFLLSLGRLQDLVLDAGAANELILKDAGAEAGKVLFRDGVPGGTTRCASCHMNAGANAEVTDSTPANRNFDTGIEQFLQNRLNDPTVTVIGEPRPFDGGFGTNPAGDFTSLLAQPGFDNENFGDLTFNTPSLIEAADTPPFFHNNAIATLEDSIRFYNTIEFQQARDAAIPFNEVQVTQVANFLRVINALDNIDNAILRQADRALLALAHQPTPHAVIDRILLIMISDIDDVRTVLTDGDLHNSGGLPVNAVKRLDKAKKRLQRAMNTNASVTARTHHIAAAEDELAAIRGLLRN